MKQLLTILCIFAMAIGTAQKKHEFKYATVYTESGDIDKEVEVDITMYLDKGGRDDKGSIMFVDKDGTRTYTVSSKDKVKTLGGQKAMTYYVYNLANSDGVIVIQIFKKKKYGTRVLFSDGTKLQLYYN